LDLRITNGDSEWQPRYIEVAAMLFVTTLLLTAIVAPKIIEISFLTISAATLVYPLTCIFGDTLTEVYGFNRTRRIIWIGLICSGLLVFFTWLAIVLPAAGSYPHQEAFATVLGSVPRIVASSFTAYFICEMINSLIMSKMKIWSKGNHFSLRAMASTVVAQAADSIVFFTMAFLGVLPGTVILKLIVTTWIVKSLYEFAVLPFTILFVRFLKQREGIEHFDNQVLHIFRF
ncbi:MAG: queuosine precursor transporter, partial [Proteobacteria bacterium]|nr:queuosine precursor transporter [Pseudomonadota bacterium]